MRAAVRARARDTLRLMRRHDTALQAAGLTFYAGIALVPSLLVAVRGAVLLVGQDRVGRLADSLAAALPDDLGAPDVARALVERGSSLSPLTALLAAVPATFYGEGLRRVFVSLAATDDTLTGWQGRLRVLPLFALGPPLTLAVLLVTPLVGDLLGAGGWSAVLAVVVAFTVVWLSIGLVLTYAYRVVSPGDARPGWAAAALAGFGTGSFVAGFVEGFVLFLSLPLDLGAPFGGARVVGAMVAVGLWLYLLHLLVVVGYAVLLAATGRVAGAGRTSPPGTRPDPPVAGTSAA